MTQLTLDNIIGLCVKDNDVYQVIDNIDLKTLTLSKTVLKPGKNTTGHRHENEEIYIFMSGNGLLETDNEAVWNVEPNDIFLINSQDFHKVYNTGAEDLVFVCVFPGARAH